MVGLSVATERATQALKQAIPSKLTVPGWAIHLCSFLIGTGVVGFSGLNPLNIHGLTSGPDVLTNPQNWLSWVLSGLLVSGGSAFWNHALDIVQATKVQKEQAVNATLPEGQKIPA